MQLCATSISNPFDPTIINRMSESSCPSDSRNCDSHFHDEDSRYLVDTDLTSLKVDLVAENSMTHAGSVIEDGAQEAQEALNVQNPGDEKQEAVFRRIIRNFTPSYVLTVLCRAVGRCLTTDGICIAITDGSSSR